MLYSRDAPPLWPLRHAQTRIRTKWTPRTTLRDTRRVQ